MPWDSISAISNYTESQRGAVPHNQETIIEITHFLEEKLNYFDVGYKD